MNGWDLVVVRNQNGDFNSRLRLVIQFVGFCRVFSITLLMQPVQDRV